MYTIILSIDKFFAVINNGGWHSISALSDKLGISNSKLIELSKFLSERGLIKYEEENAEQKFNLYGSFFSQKNNQINPKTSWKPS